ncbi:BAG family molecular chaperone regulator 6-like [Andrographis paniculata]|uniref:BAG family molecular chaperone regulator 6-like n=1 Tax=Andrographis paniculata TaxID=175694 RepID=UPI0021E74C39|nr:BAG family molecular chaperone regulator 6-like [Andrographis paniculata]
MASHHHFCHHSAAVAACNCGCCCASYTPCHPHLHHAPPPPPPSSTGFHQPHFYRDYTNPPNPPHFPQIHQDRSFQDQRPTHAAVTSLLRRISALESALRRRSPEGSASHSLRAAAARTIQTYFRAYLCRRSRTLRQLQDLAAIKSTLGTLKTLISKNPQFDYDVVYHKTLNLLLKLDAIQGDDPMIRNGKSSLTAELNKFLDIIDGICLEGKAQLIGLRKTKRKGDDLKSRVSNVQMKLGNLKIGNSKVDNVDKLSALLERIDKLAEEINEEEDNQSLKNSINGVLRSKIGARSKSKKNVSFVEDGRVYKVPRRPGQPLLEDYSNSEDDDLDREIEELDDKDDEHVENGDVEKGSRSYKSSEEDDDEEEEDELVYETRLPGGGSIHKRTMKVPS